LAKTQKKMEGKKKLLSVTVGKRKGEFDHQTKKNAQPEVGSCAHTQKKLRKGTREKVGRGFGKLVAKPDYLSTANDWLECLSTRKTTSRSGQASGARERRKRKLENQRAPWGGWGRTGCP